MPLKSQVRIAGISTILCLSTVRCTSSREARISVFITVSKLGYEEWEHVDTRHRLFSCIEIVPIVLRSACCMHHFSRFPRTNKLTQRKNVMYTISPDHIHNLCDKEFHIVKLF
jgi:hypothetical protein